MHDSEFSAKLRGAYRDLRPVSGSSSPRVIELADSQSVTTGDLRPVPASLKFK